MSISGLFTDLYELTMAQGYFMSDHNPRVVFDMFFRRPPYGGGYTVFAGLDDLLDNLKDFSYSKEDIAYLRSLELFEQSFLDFLKDLRFRGNVSSFAEGSLVFPGEPLVRVEASLIEAQLIESLVLNVINFQTLVATKAARVFVASRFGSILEFGMRRAQGYNGALTASRAAYIGGASGTSNTLSGKQFGIPVKGTMAHSWVMAFGSELEAFRRYAEIYPESAILLIDTYDTLGSGIKNAIIVGLELKESGKNFGVRLDSGDLSYLSKQVRIRLDEAGLENANIAVSGDLNEEIILQLLSENSPIDLWGVGTQLATGHPDASLTGVYKLGGQWSDEGFLPSMKVSNNSAKMSNPGFKQVYRFYDQLGGMLRDLIVLDDEPLPDGAVELYHPTLHFKHVTITDYSSVNAQLKPVMKDGEILRSREKLPAVRARVINQLKKLDGTYLRIINPHEYKISLSRSLRDLKFRMIDEFSGNLQNNHVEE